MSANKHSSLSLRGSEAGAIWDDRLAPILAALAPPERWEVERASEVEFEAGEWVARLARPMRGLAAGTEIARARSRVECIAGEVEWLSARPVAARYLTASLLARLAIEGDAPAELTEKLRRGCDE